MEEIALTGPDPELGETAAPVAPADAERAADEAQLLAELHDTSAQRKRDGVWTAPREDAPARPAGPVGLIRDEDSAVEPPDQGDGGSDARAPASGSAGDDPAPAPPGDSGDRRDQGDENEVGTGDDGPTDDGKSDRGGGNDSPPQDDPSPRPRPPSEPTFRALGGASDAADDASGQAPRYADIRQLLIESNGARARLTVAVSADIPRVLENGEVQGIGIDFYRSDDTESDYQVFIDGGSDGWRAFLHTPDGVVQYPGSFGVGGRVFVLEIPWQSLGGREPARVNMFIDWSQQATPVNRVGNDRAPDEGKVRVDPR